MTMAEYIERGSVMRTAHILRPEDKELMSVISIIPAAEVAPVRHGRWISWDEADNFIPSPHRHECSACHDAAQVLTNGFELLSDYCPNCGARMEGAENE